MLSIWMRVNLKQESIGESISKKKSSILIHAVKCNWPFSDRLWSICSTYDAISPTLSPFIMFALHILCMKLVVGKGEAEFCWHMILNALITIYRIFQWFFTVNNSCCCCCCCWIVSDFEVCRFPNGIYCQFIAEF